MLSSARVISLGANKEGERVLAKSNDFKHIKPHHIMRRRDV